MTGLEGLKQCWSESQNIQIPKLTKLELKTHEAENISLGISWRADFLICICIIKGKYRETYSEVEYKAQTALLHLSGFSLIHNCTLTDCRFLPSFTLMGSIYCFSCTEENHILSKEFKRKRISVTPWQENKEAFLNYSLHFPTITLIPLPLQNAFSSHRKITLDQEKHELLS